MNKVKASRFAVAVLIIFIGLEGIFFLYLVPKIRLSRITILGDLTLSNQEIFSLLNWNRRPLYFSLNTDEIAEKLRKAAGEDITVRKEWPDHLIIRSLSRGALFVSSINNRVIYFNEHGSVVSAVDASEILPVVIFLPDVDERSLKQDKLPEWIISLGKLKRRYADFYKNIESINQHKDSIYVKFRDMPFFVRLKPDFSIKKIRHVYWQTKQIFESRFAFSRVLDMRGSEIVYNVQGGHI